MMTFGTSRVSTLRADSLTKLLIAGSLFLGIGVAGHLLQPRISATVSAVTPAVQQAVASVAQSAPVQAAGNLGAAAAAAASALMPYDNVSRVTELDDDQTFADLLMDAGVAETEANAAQTALAHSFNMHNLHAGQSVTLNFRRTAEAETFTGAVFQPEATQEVVLQRDAAGAFNANLKQIPIVRHRLAAKGEIHTSLYEAGERVGVPHAVMAALIHTYAHDVDFQRDVHAGDSFEVLYDQPMTAQGKAVGEGTIVYAALHIGGKVKPLYRVVFSDKTVDYFDDQGRSVRRALLRTPVAAARVTSGFGMRMHPLLGYSKMHKGVDFGAPTGTPIFAAGSGTIEDIGFKNGYGRYIKIKHNGTMATAYAHMSRFNTHLYRGSKVNQGEVIGYVGMSGRATGPHLHFEVHLNGQQVNPMSVNLPAGRVLEGKLLAEFKDGQDHIRKEFSDLIAANQNTPVPTAQQQMPNPALIKAATMVAVTPAQSRGL